LQYKILLKKVIGHEIEDQHHTTLKKALPTAWQPWEKANSPHNGNT